AIADIHLQDEGEARQPVAQAMGGKIRLGRLLQTPVMLCEFETVEGNVKSDPRWIAAVKKRGINDEDIPLIQIDPFSSGYFG
ncbi:hypothetical protein ACC724_39350, partial [Rhizobium ruizarguesonis]